MEQNKIMAVITIAVLVIAGIVVVVYNSGSTDAEGITVTDMRGREVTLSDDIETIVCQDACSLRLVSYMGCIDRVVGIDSFDGNVFGSPANYYMATYRIAYNLSDIEVVGDDTELIKATNADVIICSTISVSELDDLQDETDIPVIAINADLEMDDMSSMVDQFELLGEIFGLQERADTLISEINGLLDDLDHYEAQVTDRASAYVGGMFYYMQGGLEMTTGNYLAFNYAGVSNVMGDLNGGQPYTTDLEDIISANPEYIFIDCMTYNESVTALQENITALNSVSAIENDTVYSTLVYKYYGTNWDTQLINMFYVGSIVYPGIFDYDIEEKANEILDLFYEDSDINYDLVVGSQYPGYSNIEL